MRVMVKNLSFSLHNQMILDDISIDIPTQSTIGLLGPNGSGKSTLLRCITGLFSPQRAHVFLNGSSLEGMNQRSLARSLAFVPQHADADGDMRVEQIVRLGRNPHRGMFSSWSKSDKDATDEAIALTQLTPLLGRYWRQLSGGEKQRCQIARALAQQPQVLLLDEPTNHLDIHHQLELMQLVSSLPMTVIVALHDLNLASHYCDHLVILKSGRLTGEGTPASILNAELLKNIWNVNATVERTGRSKARILFDYDNSSDRFKFAS